jgi:hypothetical protein
MIRVFTRMKHAENSDFIAWNSNLKSLIQVYKADKSDG